MLPRIFSSLPFLPFLCRASALHGVRYRSPLGIPAPGASLPVAAFLLLGIYGKVIWLIILPLIPGVGHIGIHLQHVKELEAADRL